MPTDELQDIFIATTLVDKALDQTIRDLAAKYNISEADVQKLQDARVDSDRENYDYFYKLGKSETLTERIKQHLKKLFK